MNLNEAGQWTLAIILVVITLFSIMYGATWFHTFHQVGVTYDVTVKVSNVERSEHLYIHTNVWAEQYISSDNRDALVYHLLGHHDELIPGQVYRIVFTNRQRFHWLKRGFFIAGEVEKIEHIPTG